MEANVPRLFAVTALAAAATLGLTGYTPVTGNKIIWQYLGQAGTPALANLPYDLKTGEPRHADYTTDLTRLPVPDLPSDLFRRIGKSLKLVKDDNRAALSREDQTLVLKPGSDFDLYASFLYEEEGTRNSVGYFTYDPSHPPASPADISSERIFFPNATSNGKDALALKNAGTQTASTVRIRIPASDKPIGVGFFIVDKGWSENGRDLSPNPNDKGNSTAGVDEKALGKSRGIFYSLKALNPEPQDHRNLNQHAVLLNDQAVSSRDGTSRFQRLILSFEDKERKKENDNDFDDVVLALHVAPHGLDSITNLDRLGRLSGSSPETDDDDGDGVSNGSDRYPDDPTAASYQDYPSSGGWATLAYEDNWPLVGDYDLNDMVMRYRSREVRHRSGKVARLEMSFRLDARGAAENNGFALALPDILPEDVESATLATVEASGKASQVAIAPLDKGIHRQAVFELFKGALAFQSGQSDSSCKFQGFYNAAAGCPIAGFTEFTLNVKLKTLNHVPSYAGQFPATPYDPFIFRLGREVHLPGKRPSDRADRSLFGTGDDASRLDDPAGYTYMTRNGLPWALNIPGVWDYPVEGSRVEGVYSDFVNWARSGGSQNQDWHTRPSDVSKTFRNGR